MQLTRRRALGLALAASSAAVRVAGADDAVSDDRALFWELGSGASASTIFGYQRIAASLVSDIIDEGSKRAVAATRIISDFSPSVRLPPIEFNPSLPPVTGKLDAKTADAFRDVVRQSFAQLLPTVDKMPGILATLLLIGEGQTPTPPNPTVGGTILEHAQQQARPWAVLISDAELRSMYHPPDQAARDNRIGQDTIAYILELRAKGGPIGRQFEELYAARRGGDVHRLADDLTRRGVFTPGDLFNPDFIKAILTGRLEAALKAKEADSVIGRLVGALNGKEADSAFVLLPLGSLLGKDGIIAALRAKGHAVTAVA